MTTARWYRAGRTQPPNLIVIHSLEYPEKVTSAEDALRFFQTTDRKASVHAVADADSVTRPVDDGDTAYGAAGVNPRALHIEHAGYAAQSPAQWLDPYGRLMLARSAKIVAGWCRTFDIPPVRLTVAQVRAGQPGICSHYDVSRAFPDVSTGHTDPGDGFPWDYYLGLVRAELEDDMPLTDAEIEKIAQRSAEIWQEKFGLRLARYLSGHANSAYSGTTMPGVEPPFKRGELEALLAPGTGSPPGEFVVEGTLRPKP